MGIVGESGSGKTTLLKAISARLAPQQGQIIYRTGTQQPVDLYEMAESQRRRLLRTEWGVVHQHPLDGLRPQVSAGGNIGERLMATGQRHYGEIRQLAGRWLEDVEIPLSRLDDLPPLSPAGCSSACKSPVICDPSETGFMDEPTGGLDVSVQARLLDLLRNLVVEMQLAVVIVTMTWGSPLIS